MTDNTPVPPQQSEVVKTTLFKPSLYGGRFTRKQYFWRVLLVAIITGFLGGMLQLILVTPPYKTDMMESATREYLREVCKVRMLEGGSCKVISKEYYNNLNNLEHYLWRCSVDADEKMERAEERRYQQEVILLNLITHIPAVIFFYLPFGIKRAHDIGHKGTFLITLYVIGLMAQLLFCFVSMEIYSILSMILAIPILIYGCILLFKDSQKGTNAYGPSSKYPDTVA